MKRSLSFAPRLGLGTAQLGLDYGVANRTGMPSEETAIRLLRAAWEKGLLLTDTAPAYGEAEPRIGRALRVHPKGSPPPRVVTKLGPASRLCRPDLPECWENEATESLRRLGVPSVHALLVHHPEDLLGPNRDPVLSALHRLQDRGCAAKIGFSCYEPEEALQILRFFTPQVVQLPLNLLDQRMRDRGILARLRELGAEIHGRSCFLQGLLFLDPETLPPRVASARPMLRGLRFLASDLGKTVEELALGFCLGIPEVDSVLVGVETSEQLERLLDVAAPLPADLFAPLSCADTSIVDPRRWGP